MSDTNQYSEVIYRDGVSQLQRRSAILNPDYIKVDERSTADLIEFSQKFAAHLVFFNQQNEASGDWTGFLEKESESFRKSLDLWMQGVSDFKDQPELRVKLTQPHRVLFLAFLQQLKHLQAQLNTFTEKHLDFYFGEILGFTQKEATPDQVHVLVKLGNDIDQFLLKAGTELNAGKDEAGNDRIYSTTEDIVANQAQVSELKTLFVDKVVTTLQNARQMAPVDVTDGGFIHLLKMVYGFPEPGDAFPEAMTDLFDGKFNANLEEDYFTLLGWLNGEDETWKNNAKFILAGFYHINPEDFRFLMSLQKNWKTSLEKEWIPVYKILDNANRDMNLALQVSHIQTDTRYDNDAEETYQKTSRLCLGNPNSGDPLPSFLGGNDPLAEVSNSISGAANDAAVAYIQDELFMSEKEFLELIALRKKVQPPATSQENWYELIEFFTRAGIKKGHISKARDLRREIIKKIVPNPQADKVESSSDNNQPGLEKWNPFGNNPGFKPDHEIQMGISILSPLLELREGKRKVMLTLALEEEGFDQNLLRKLFEPPENTDLKIAPNILDFFFSSEKDWIQPRVTGVEIGNLLTGAPLRTFSSISDYSDYLNKRATNSILSVDSPDYFNPTDEGRLIIVPPNPATVNGRLEVLEIDKYKDPQQIEYQTFAKQLDENYVASRLFEATALFENAIRFTLELDLDQPAVCSSLEKGEFNQWPGLVIALATPKGENADFQAYQMLQKLVVEKVNLTVEVEGISSIQLENDETLLNPEKPFELFGPQPTSGTHFYLAYPEICRKKLAHLSLNLTWKGLPETSFETHYQNYKKVDNGKTESPYPNSRTIVDGNSFKISPYLIDGSSQLEIWPSHNTGINLFSEKLDTNGKPQSILEESEIKIENISDLLPDHNYQRRPNLSEGNNPLNWQRHLKFRLNKPDFLHSIYPELVTQKAARSFDQNGRVPIWADMDLPEPYTPEVASIKLSYSASIEFVPGESTGVEGEEIRHNLPFGSRKASSALENEKSPLFQLLPEFPNEGELYLGIKDLQPPQNISLLIKMVAGTADPEIIKPDVDWFVLGNEGWINLDESNIIFDQTIGLRDTGIIRMEIPAEASKDNPEMQPGMHWLRVIAKEIT